MELLPGFLDLGDRFLAGGAGGFPLLDGALGIRLDLLVSRRIATISFSSFSFAP
jgi:hypothetical protein